MKLDPFTEIDVPKISDLIIRQILNLMHNGALQPGDKLPSELQLQKSLGVAKQQLKAAFKKLELYGVLETKPQSGSFIANMESKILCGLISNILDIEDTLDPVSVMDTRMVLELRAVELAADRMTEQELDSVKKANDIFLSKSRIEKRAIEDDIYFHLEIVKYSHSTALIALFSFITRQIVDIWKQMDVFSKDKTRKRIKETYSEHVQIIKYLEKRDVSGSVEAMRIHLLNVCKDTEALRRC